MNYTMPNVEINTTSNLFLMFFSMDSLKDKSVSHCSIELQVLRFFFFTKKGIFIQNSHRM